MQMTRRQNGSPYANEVDDALDATCEAVEKQMFRMFSHFGRQSGCVESAKLRRWAIAQLILFSARFPHIHRAFAFKAVEPDLCYVYYAQHDINCFEKGNRSLANVANSSSNGQTNNQPLTVRSLINIQS